MNKTCSSCAHYHRKSGKRDITFCTLQLAEDSINNIAKITELSAAAIAAGCNDWERRPNK